MKCDNPTDDWPSDSARTAAFAMARATSGIAPDLLAADSQSAWACSRVSVVESLIRKITSSSLLGHYALTGVPASALRDAMTPQTENPPPLL